MVAGGVLLWAAMRMRAPISASAAIVAIVFSLALGNDLRFHLFPRFVICLINLPTFESGRAIGQKQNPLTDMMADAPEPAAV